MIVSVTNQVYVFLSCILGGLAIGLLFDLFRLLRRFIETKDILTHIEDIIFWVLVGAVVLLTVYLSNNGQLRGYVFLGIILGVIFYFLVLSNIVIRILGTIINISIKTVNWTINIMTGPVKTIFRLIYIPIKYLFGKFKYIKKFMIRLKKIFDDQVMKFNKSKKIIKEKI